MAYGTPALLLETLTVYESLAPALDWLADHAQGIVLLVASGLAIVALFATSLQHSARLKQWLASMCAVMTIVLVVATDWPGTRWSQFWQNHPLFSAVLVTGLLLGVGLLTYDRRTQIERAKRADRAMVAAVQAGASCSNPIRTVAMDLLYQTHGFGDYPSGVWGDLDAQPKNLSVPGADREAMRARVADLVQVRPWLVFAGEHLDDLYQRWTRHIADWAPVLLTVGAEERLLDEWLAMERIVHNLRALTHRELATRGGLSDLARLRDQAIDMLTDAFWAAADLRKQNAAGAVLRRTLIDK